MTEPRDKHMEPFINRELSLLEFNQRVLALATDPALPLLERLRFLCISSSNLDEFFEIRVAGLKQLGELGTPVEEQLAAIYPRAAQLIADQYQCLNTQLLPELNAAGVRLQARDSWPVPDRDWLEKYFHLEVEPVLSPLGLDPARPFPRIQNKSLNFVVRLEGKDAFGRNTELAIVQVPRSLPRVVRVANGASGVTLVLLSNIVAEFMPLLFPGMAVRGCYPFRVTRNSDLFVDEEEIDDLRRALEGELAHRRYGASVRLETSVDCPDDIADFLLKEFSLDRDDLYRVSGPVNLNRLSVIYDLAGRSDLKYQPFTPVLPELVSAGVDMFEQVRARDWLLHHPFQSFAPVMDFLRLAAADPQVLAIKQTLYRTGTESPIVDALVTASNNGKDVTAIIELRARFDEEANIDLASRLQEAGVHVMYGVVGYKTHAKMLLVVRRESDGIRRYCHLGTGNYHHKTARAYTDYGLLTSNESIALDVHEIFLQLTSLTRTPKLRQLLQSPFTLHERLLEMIRGQGERGAKGRVIARMNALTEPQVIEALYAASRLGCRVDLIVRGMCALRPGVPGMSENITVRSVVGRFLEHPRVWCFGEGKKAQLYCASADWMERNLFRRVEIAFPILDPPLHAQLRDDLDLYLADTADAWLLQSDGSYLRAREGVTEPVSAQIALLQRYLGGHVG
ncbi:MAG: polyphosphate kinase 1 [Pseudomonadota bacterium]